MSITPTAPSVARSRSAGALSGTPPAPRTRRVRHQARESLALMAFSAVTSVGVAAVLLLVVSLGR
jgi:hypothetical protein